jgi:multisubunit Na+/H+ antiporter MnhC subunit
MPKVSGLAMGIILIVVGILVIAFPDLLRWILGIGLIVVGLLAILRK